MTASSDRRIRRGLLVAPLVGGLAAILGTGSRPARAQEKASLIAKSVAKVPEGVDESDWRDADVLSVPLAPQTVVKPRLYEAGVKALSVRALYDADRVAFLLEWADSRADSGLGSVASFRDAVALQFPADPANGIPYFGMGEPNRPVTIYQWKADWQFGPQHDVDERYPAMVSDWYPFTGRAAGEVAEATDYGSETGEKAFHTSWWAGNLLGDPDLQARTPVEKLEAEGFGTLTSVGAQRQDAAGNGAWKDGVWKVQISIPRAQEIFAFEPGMTIPVAFAAWDGAKGERGGEKAVSTWYFVSLERPVGRVVYWGPVVALVGTAAAQAWALRHLRRAARERAESSGSGSDDTQARA